MAINTSGYQVNVLPQFTPADPKLIAFNPESITNGVLTSFKIADTANRIKAFQALQAQLDATRAGEISATNATNTLSTARATADLGQVPAVSALQALKTEAGINETPILSKLRIQQAGTESKDLEEKEALRDIVKVTNRNAAQTAQNQSVAANVVSGDATSDAIVMHAATIAQAKLNRDKAIAALASFPQDTKLKQAAEQADIELKNATAELHKANAELARQKPDNAVEIAKIRAAATTEAARVRSQAHNELNDLVKIAQNDEFRANQIMLRLGSVKVPNPDPNTMEERPEVPLSELKDMAFTEGDDGKLKPKEKSVFFGPNAKATIGQQALALLQQYQTQIQRVKTAQTWQDELSSALKDNFKGKSDSGSTPSPKVDTDLPVYGIVIGKYQQIK